jgi:hypothetical protein
MFSHGIVDLVFGGNVRKVTFGGANSLDNYFARKNHAVDWLLWSDEAAGKGKAPYPGMKHQIDLELLECRAFKNGCVLVKYRVKG